MRFRHVLLLALVPACLVEEPASRPEGTPRAFGVVADDVVSDRIGTSTGGEGGGGDVDGWTQLVPGSHCAAHADCDSEEGAGDGYCYRGDVGGSIMFPDEGYCTIDDGTGTVCAEDADCPGTSKCADMDGYRLCLPACGEDDSCPSGQACLSSFGGLPINTSVCLPGEAGAQDGDACTGFQDCGPSSTCWKDLEHPGGYCSAYSCTIGTNEGCNGGTCIEFKDGPSTGTVCVAACESDDECRADEGYECHDPDGDGGVASYCRRPHVGDACASSEDCGEGFTCKTDEGWSGGYCTVSGCPVVGSTAGCSSGSVCASVDGANTCVDRCTGIGSQGTCRSDYTCQAVVTGGTGGCLVPES